MSTIYLKDGKTSIGTTDTYNISNQPSGPLTFDFGDGSLDKVIVESTVSNVTLNITNIELVQGGSGNETINDYSTGNSFVLGGGYDIVNLGLGVFQNNKAYVDGVEEVHGDGLEDTIVFKNPNNSNTTTLYDIEIAIGTTNSENITLATKTSVNPNAISVVDKVKTTNFSLGEGTDSVTLGNFLNYLTVSGVETVKGGNNYDYVAFADVMSKETISNVENIYFNKVLNKNVLTISGNEAVVHLGAFQNDFYVSGATEIIGDATRINTVRFFGDNKTEITNFYNSFIYGGIGSDNISLNNMLTKTTTLNLGNGFDTLNLLSLGDYKNEGVIQGVEVLNGSTYGMDDITLLGNNNITATNIDKLTGGVGSDYVTFSTSYNNDLNLSNGLDKVVFNGVGNNVNLSYVETLLGSSGNDIITQKTQVKGNVFDFKDGSDTLTLGNFTNSLFVSNAEIIVGGTGGDTVNLFGSENHVKITSVEAIFGGIGADDVTFGQALKSTNIINLGTGFDTLHLADGVINVGTISGVESLFGGTGKDYVTLSGSANAITVTDVEYLTGGEGIDKVTVTNSFSGSIDLAAGNDKLTFSGSSNSAQVSNVEVLAGGSGVDSIAYKTALINGVIDLKGGNDTIKLGDFINSATFYNTEKIITGALNDSITLGNKLTSEIISYSNGNDSIINFDMTKDKIDISNSGTITFNQTNKTILDGATVIGSYNDSSADLILHFNSTNTNVTLTGIDTLSATNFII